MAGVAILFSIWFVAGAFIYFALVRQIVARSVVVDGAAPVFGFAEALVAGFLTLWFAFLSVATVADNGDELTNGVIIGSVLFTIAVVAVIAFMLQLRGRHFATLA